MKKNIIITILTIVAGTIVFNLNKAAGFTFLLLVFAVLLQRNLSNIYALKAMKNYGGGNVKDALKFYERAYKFKNSSPTVRTNYAYILLREGELQRPIKILQDLLEKPLSDKDKISATLNLSLALWKQNDLDGAITLLRDLYDKGYKTTIMYQNLGFFYVAAGDLEKALEFNLEAYDYNDSDTSILDNLALNYYLMEDYDKALELYEKIIPSNPTFATAYYYYGLVLKTKERYEEALEMFEKALTCRFSALSPVKKEEIEKEIEEVNQKQI